MTHELKLWPVFWDDVYHGLKTFDVRKCRDRNFKQFDIVKFREWDPQTSAYTGREMMALVTYVLGAPDMRHWNYVYEDTVILAIKVLLP